MVMTFFEMRLVIFFGYATCSVDSTCLLPIYSRLIPAGAGCLVTSYDFLRFLEIPPTLGLDTEKWELYGGGIEIDLRIDR